MCSECPVALSPERRILDPRALSTLRLLFAVAAAIFSRYTAQSFALGCPAILISRDMQGRQPF